MATPQDTLAPEPAGALSPPSLLQILWGRKAIILLGAVVGVTLGALYYAQRKPVYESTVQVWVERKTPDVPVPGYDSNGFVEDYLATQINILISPKVVGPAVRGYDKDEIKTLKTFHGLTKQEAEILEKAAGQQPLSTLHSFQGMSEYEIVSTIRGSLKVSREGQQTGGTGPSTITLLYRGADADDCKEILEAIVTSYQLMLLERYRDKDKELTEKLVDNINVLEPELKKLNEQLLKLESEGPIKIGKDGVTVQEEQLATIQSRRAGLNIHAKELESRIQMIEAEINRGGDPTVLIEATEGKPVTTPSGTIGMSASSEATIDVQLMPQLVELSELQRKYGPGHPEVVSLRNKIDTAREILKSTNSGARGKLPYSSAMPESNVLAAGPCSIGLLAAPNGQGPLLASTTLLSTRSIKWETLHYLELLRAQLRDVQLTEQALKDLAEKAVSEVHSMAGFRSQESTLREEIANKKKHFEAFTTLHNDRNTLGSGGGYKAEAIAPPGQGVQVEPKPTPIFTVALLLGLGAGVLLAWLAEATDKSFRTPEEVRRRLGLPVVGHVPRITPRNEEVRQHEAGTLALDPSICAYYQSKSIEAESFRGIRTTLYFGAQNEGCKIIQVSSPNMGDGKTTLATNLAVSIAQSGKRILLIDADFRRPRLHRMFGLRARVGLATVIQDDTELTDAIQPCTVPNLSILPCGPRPNNPAELLTSPRFKEALEALRDRYDVILVDTPPLLAVSDPSVVASQVDGVLMTIRVSKNGRPSAERARDILASIGANVLGVVVNGIGSRSKEGYGASHYGYEYQYQYAYEPTDNRSYYQDNQEADSQVHRNGEATNGHAPQPAHHDEPIDPDAVDVGALPVKPEPQRVRERVPHSRRKESDTPGVVGGLARWLRSTLWH